jgi:hypothetical protein
VEHVTGGIRNIKSLGNTSVAFGMQLSLAGGTALLMFQTLLRSVSLQETTGNQDKKQFHLTYMGKKQIHLRKIEICIIGHDTSIKSLCHQYELIRQTNHPQQQSNFYKFMKSNACSCSPNGLSFPKTGIEQLTSSSNCSIFYQSI